MVLVPLCGTNFLHRPLMYRMFIANADVYFGIYKTTANTAPNVRHRPNNHRNLSVYVGAGYGSRGKTSCEDGADRPEGSIDLMGVQQRKSSIRMTKPSQLRV